MVGNFKNVINFFEQFSILGTTNGLIKYVSEYKADKKQLNNLFSTTFVFGIIATLTSFIILFFLSKTMNEVVFRLNSNYTFIFKILTFIIPFMGINGILYALLNGLSDYKLYSNLTLSTIVASTFLIIVLTLNYGIKGSLLALSLTPIIQFFNYIIFFGKYHKPYLDFKKIAFNLSFKNRLLSYSLMTITVILFINVTDVVIRNLIEERVSMAHAGYWTAMTSISKTYMQFSAAIFLVYIAQLCKNIHYFRF